ncbi:MAG: hypothetical protein KY449_09865 [Proteobacteria bacterium]|nr:hypothetical protein [Pseudomonadota bacterium]
MVKAPKNPWGSAKIPNAPKPQERPLPRKTAYEATLCDAIRQGVLVEVRYDNEDRLFAPQVVHHSSQRKVVVYGVQTANLTKPAEASGPRTFEVGGIQSLALTNRPVPTLLPINRADERYRNGIICP